MTQAEAESINRNLPGLSSGDPGRIFNRIQLLGYYDNQKDADSGARAHELIIWLVENEPSVNLCWRPVNSRAPFNKQEFEQIKQLWLDQTEKHPTEPIVFCNAAHFLMADDDYLDSYPKVEELLDKAALIGSTNSDIHSLIARYYYSCSIIGGYERENQLLSRSISEYEKALGIINASQFPSSYSRQDVLTDLTKATFRIGDDKAVFYAKDLLRTMPPASEGRPRRVDQINLANTVLGLNAIKLGDIDRAGNYLIESAVGEGHIDAIAGPNLCLAQKLSELGKRRVVLEYLRKCETIWPRGIDTLHKWEAMLDKGESPSFFCEPESW